MHARGHHVLGNSALWIGQAMALLATTVAVVISSTLPTSYATSVGKINHFPPLDLVKSSMLTTAARDFADHDSSFLAAHHWQRAKLLGNDKPAPYLACAEYGQGCRAREHLERAFSGSGVYKVAHNKDHGACFIVTALPSEAESLMDDPRAFGISYAGPFLTVLKVSPGLLDHGSQGETNHQRSPSQLGTTYGERIKMPDMRGLSVRLSPGVMEKHQPAANTLVEEWRASFKLGSVDTMKSSNFWSDPSMLQGDDGHMSRPESKVLAREWTRAAEVVGDMIKMGSDSIGEACRWDEVYVHPVEDDVVFMSGMDHLLPGDKDEETRTACFMCLLSHLASKPEVLRVSPLYSGRLFNGVAAAIVQSGNIVDTPLHDAGLDGTGEVIQIVDSGLDETSCFFVDEDGLEIEHGYYFKKLSYYFGSYHPLVTTGSFYYDLTRRKIVQYMDLFKKADPEVDQVDGDGYYYWSEVFGTTSEGGFQKDEEEGHGTHTAGTAAGAAIADFTLSTCSTNYVAGCVGKCITTDEVTEATGNNMLDIDTYCPTFDCDGDVSWSPNCLSSDPTENLISNDGVAPGAKLAIFDVSHDGDSYYTPWAGNDIWEASSDTGAKVHSNSWGTSDICTVTETDIMYDEYMYENPEHLLIFAAGNYGGFRYNTPVAYDCTIVSPAVGKNVLAVGATSTGPTQIPTTGTDGRARYEERGFELYDEDGLPWIDSYPWLGAPSTSSEGADIDTVASFSGYGPTDDVRIKPEVVAPGDRIFSASSDGSDGSSCVLSASFGTSMATPVVAGAAALVRQYFTNAIFYANDVEARGLCGTGSGFSCGSFAPSAATVKAVLINSADLMGGSTYPDGLRGFGRVHLEAGLPIGGQGNLALYVADSSTTTISEYYTRTYTFNVDGAAGEEFRTTLSWIDPPSTTFSTVHLLNDLDLAVTAPDGTVYYMWDNGPSVRNVNERVIVLATDVMSGVWTVAVTAYALTTTSQSYSLVVTGALTT